MRTLLYSAQCIRINPFDPFSDGASRGITISIRSVGIIVALLWRRDLIKLAILIYVNIFLKSFQVCEHIAQGGQQVVVGSSYVESFLSQSDADPSRRVVSLVGVDPLAVPVE